MPVLTQKIQHVKQETTYEDRFSLDADLFTGVGNLFDLSPMEGEGLRFKNFIPGPETWIGAGYKTIGKEEGKIQTTQFAVP
jgi:hypothetical protein